MKTRIISSDPEYATILNLATIDGAIQGWVVYQSRLWSITTDGDDYIFILKERNGSRDRHLDKFYTTVGLDE